MENITKQTREPLQELVDRPLYRAGRGRLISNIVLKSDLFDMPVVGFENPWRTDFYRENQPLGKVLYGSGNDGQTGYEGVVYKNVIGTYLHGPLLPKNPQLADWLIARALEQKYHKSVELCLLDDSQEAEANAYVYHRFVKRPGRGVKDMAKSYNQKGKILYLERILQGTGENHTVSMQEILDELSWNRVYLQREKAFMMIWRCSVFLEMDIRYKRGKSRRLLW